MLSESVLLALIEKIPYGWLVFFGCAILTYRGVRKAVDCLLRSFNKFLMKEIIREDKYNKIAMDYKAMTEKNNQLFEDNIRELTKNSEIIEKNLLILEKVLKMLNRVDRDLNNNRPPT